ncbi:MAG: VWA domain-containing protein [Devosiaceae bacterium]|nr:VWA domain-containing protein [Devosiaceae bacterium MH13]
MAPPRELPPTDGRLVENIIHFTRALRKAGMRVGTAQVEDAIRAVQAVGFTNRAEYHHTLRAVLVNRPEQLELFDQTFALFWRDPDYLARMIHMLSPTVRKDDADKPPKKSAERRAAEALAQSPEVPDRAPDREQLEIDASFSWSQNETLRSMDFEQMSASESAQAAMLMRTLRLPVPPLRSRRFRPATKGKVDARATLRRSLRRGGEADRLVARAPRPRAPALVVLCDISGSMTAYARMMMHFLHALTWHTNAPGADRQWSRVHAFTFGTRLTNISRSLQHRDVDRALDAVSADAQDWQGGTRIGPALERFNKDWSRRVLGQGAVVLLITDGLERDDTELLARQAQRLARSCHQLIWLNPLLRWDGFEPVAGGMRALLPAVDGLYACHNLKSLAGLGEVFASGAVTAPSKMRTIAA